MKQNMLLLCLLISAFLTVSCKPAHPSEQTPILLPPPIYSLTPLATLEPGETRLPQTPSANDISWPPGPIPGPGVTPTPAPTFQETTDVALLLDISKSFEELCSNTEKELRLNIPRFVIGFARGYHGVAHDHAAQIQLGWDVFPDNNQDKSWELKPLSEFDGDVWYKQIEQDLAVSERGLGFMEAIQDAVNKLQASEARRKVIILITDGMMDYYQLESIVDAEERSIRNVVPSLLRDNNIHLQVLQFPCLGDSANTSDSQGLLGRRQIWKELNGDNSISDRYSLVDLPANSNEFSNYITAIFEGEEASLAHFLPARIGNEAGWDWIKEPTAVWQTPGDTHLFDLYAVLVNDQTTVQSNTPNFSNKHNEPPNLLRGSERYETSLTGCAERQENLQTEPTSLMGIYWWEAKTLESEDFKIEFEGPNVSSDENGRPIIRLYNTRDFELNVKLSNAPRLEACYEYKIFFLVSNNLFGPFLPHEPIEDDTLSYRLSYAPGELGLSPVTVSFQIWRTYTSSSPLTYVTQASIPLQVYFEPSPISYSWSCSGSEVGCQLQLKLDFVSAEYYVNNAMVPELYALTPLPYLDLQNQKCAYTPQDQTVTQGDDIAYQIYQDNDRRKQSAIFFTRNAANPNSETITVSLPQNWLGSSPCQYKRIVLQFPQDEDRWPRIICDWQGNQMNCFASADTAYRVSKN